MDHDSHRALSVSGTALRPEALADFCTRAFVAAGLPDEDARTVAALMVEADLQGSDGHGVIRLAPYIRRIKAGGIKLRPDIRITEERAATALLDGDNGMGHLVMSRAAEIAARKARQCGIAWVGARLSNHAGPASLYARMALPHDMVGLYFAVGNANHLPPWGGLDMLLSTNPIAVAVPSAASATSDASDASDDSGGAPVVLDMATTVAAYGKVKAKAQRGEAMPEGWMIDRQGRPLLDPKRADEGFLLPIGGYKGYGLSLIVGLLAGTLNGAAMGREVIDFNHDFTSTTNTGQAIAMVDIGGLRRRGRVQAARGDRGARPAGQPAHARRRPHLAARRAEPRQARGLRARRHPRGAGAAHRARPAWPPISASRRRRDPTTSKAQTHPHEANEPQTPARTDNRGRRRYRCAAGAGAAAASPTAHAEPGYPTRPIRMIVPLGAGSAVDVAARIVVQKMSDQHGPADRRREHRRRVGHRRHRQGGQGGARRLHHRRLQRQHHDHGAGAAAQAALGHPARLRAGVAGGHRRMGRWSAHPSAPFDTPAALIKAAKAAPGKVDYGSGGIGSPQHIAMALFASDAGIVLNHVPYKGASDLATGLAGNQVPVAFQGLASVNPLVKGKRLKLLAVGTPKRMAQYPDVPTVSARRACRASSSTPGSRSWRLPARRPTSSRS